MKTTMRVLKLVGEILNVISEAALLFMVGLTFADVLLRLIFKAPITGAVEMARMMMVCMAPTFVTALIEHRHVDVGLIVDRLSPGAQLGFDIFGYGLTAALSALMCYQGFLDMMKKMAQRQVYTLLKIPTWPFWMVFAVSMGFFAVAILIVLANKIYVRAQEHSNKDKEARANV